ncbi:MAG: hypothetical protein A4E61_01083 [Syntrophorhabdus sp. PtaB.Bin184]|nr:MAG: hypothetical protein A4E61_01083 [Syntrophorhabdus sp. PtaB.Bin184]
MKRALCTDTKSALGNTHQRQILVVLKVRKEAVKSHAENLLSKLKAANRTEAVAKPMKYGL